MEDSELKRRIGEFCRHWSNMAGDDYDPEEVDWDEYGDLEAHLLRFCRALIEGTTDQQWSWVDADSNESRARRYAELWPTSERQRRRQQAERERLEAMIKKAEQQLADIKPNNP